MKLLVEKPSLLQTVLPPKVKQEGKTLETGTEPRKGKRVVLQRGTTALGDSSHS